MIAQPAQRRRHPRAARAALSAGGFPPLLRVSPGKEASQRSSLAVPRRRPARVALTSGRNGGAVSRRSVSCSPSAVPGHHDCAVRAGNRSRSRLLRGAPGLPRRRSRASCGPYASPRLS